MIGKLGQHCSFVTMTITPDDVASTLRYRFRDPALLSEALTHASSADDRLQSNERLEFLGDSVLGYVICSYLFRTFADLLEGEMTKIKSAAVSRRQCAVISDELGLVSLLNMGKGMSNRPQVPESVAAAAYEAIIAAIYLDGGMDPAEQFILWHMRPVIDEMAESSHQHNFKSVLQQYAQRHQPANPTYPVLDEKGPDHAKCFEICAEIGPRRFPSAWARNKKQAEQDAALLALQALNLASVDADGNVTVCEAAFKSGPSSTRR
jgi:ribonuclease-3